jgi:purine-binding chemotaxis protein CheW
MSAGREKFLCFSLGPEEYAVKLMTVKEVIAKPEVTYVPQSPSYFLGIMNLRGQVISVIDLRTKLGVKPNESAENAVIIFDIKDAIIGVVVDSVNAVLAPDPNEISDKPEIHGSNKHNYIEGVYRWNDQLVLFLNIAKALGVEDINHAAKSVQKVA